MSTAGTKPQHKRSSAGQCWPLSRWRGWCLLLPLLAAVSATPAAAAACAGPLLPMQRLGAGLWWVPGHSGEADAANRGQVSHLLLARQPAATPRWWALGSGPTPAFGARLACQLRQRLGGTVSDVISPWARPELVLGVAGLAAAAAPGQSARHWAHTSVADAMAEQCAHCVDRLAQRLQAAAPDLGDDPVRVPEHRLLGESGRLGPWQWWRLPRAEGRWVTVWRAQGQPLWVAHGLLSEGAPPDGRDADLLLLQQSCSALAALAAVDGPSARFVGEQGALMDSNAPARHAAYWAALLQAARQAIERGDDETAPAPVLAGFPPGWASHPWHSFNWQRAWRQVEPLVLAAPPR